MTSITDTLCAIERRAERAIVQELRLMIQEILAMRTQLTLDERAHAASGTRSEKRPSVVPGR